MNRSGRGGEINKPSRVYSPYLRLQKEILKFLFLHRAQRGRSVMVGSGLCFSAGVVEYTWRGGDSYETR